MDTRVWALRGIALICGLVAVGLVGLGLAVVYGFSTEYAGGTGLQILPLLVVAAGGAAGLAVWSWPGLGARLRWSIPLGVVVLVALGGLAADQLGDRAHDRRLLAGSDELGCNGPNSEVLVDERVDETFAALPRRAPLYGPIEGTRHGCTAAVDGAAETTFPAYADAFRDLDGWQVVEDRPERFRMRRGGVEVTLAMTGSPDRLTTLRVQVVDGG